MAIIEYATLTEISDDLKDYAKEDKETGKYKVNVTPTDKLSEFRTNNVKLSQERDSLKLVLSKYEQVTNVPSEEAEVKLDAFAKEYEALRTTKKRVDDGVLVENTSLDEAAAARVTEVTKSYQAQLAEAAKERDALKARTTSAEERANNMLVENVIRVAASDPAVAMHEKAVTLLLSSAMKVFRVDENNKVVPKDTSGAIIYGQDGVSPMTAKEWLLKQRDENSFLFKGTQGGDASGGKDKSFNGKLTLDQVSKLPLAEQMNLARKANSK